MFESVEECIADADLIVTATFASRPVMKASKGLKAEGCHIMAVGAPRHSGLFCLFPEHEKIGLFLGMKNWRF